MRTDILDRKDDILQWISEGKSKAFISKELHCKPETLNSYLKKMGIEYAGRQDWNKGNKSNAYKTAEEYAKKDNPRASVLLYKLVRDNIKEPKCEICGLSEWCNDTIPLELHHKDGNHYNNDLDNLQVLCPNCHAMSHGNLGVKTGLYSEINNRKKNEQLQEKRVEERVKCPKCGKNLMLKNSTMCRECYNFSQRVTDWPTRKELKELIRVLPFTTIGKQFNVSDNAVRKWCDYYGLPRKSKDIKAMSDTEWEQI